MCFAQINGYTRQSSSLGLDRQDLGCHFCLCGKERTFRMSWRSSRFIVKWVSHSRKNNGTSEIITSLGKSATEKTSHCALLISRQTSIISRISDNYQIVLLIIMKLMRQWRDRSIDLSTALKLQWEIICKSAVLIKNYI